MAKDFSTRYYDVTDMLSKGNNAIGAVLGDGWYRGTLAMGNNWAFMAKDWASYAVENYYYRWF